MLKYFRGTGEQVPPWEGLDIGKLNSILFLLLFISGKFVKLRSADRVNYCVYF